MKLLIAVLLSSLAALMPAAAQGQGRLVADNSEMATLFERDQAVRKALTPAQAKDHDFVVKMVAGDRLRRERTRAMLDAGALRTANDFYHAAFVFQHGGTANDYLLAHTLALASTAKGHPKASWIAAATLDRYLQEIGQKQIYGTQYAIIGDQGPTMDPYDRTLIPDALLDVLGVPSRARQEERLAEMKTRGASR